MDFTLISPFFQPILMNFARNFTKLTEICYFQFQRFNFHINVFELDPQTTFQETSYQAMIFRQFSFLQWQDLMDVSDTSKKLALR